MVNSKDLAYHKNQFNTIYRSTKVFDMWLMQMGVLNDTRNVVDIACGAGSNTIFLQKNIRKLIF